MAAGVHNRSSSAVRFQSFLNINVQLLDVLGYYCLLKWILSIVAQLQHRYKEGSGSIERGGRQRRLLSNQRCTGGCVDAVLAKMAAEMATIFACNATGGMCLHMQMLTVDLLVCRGGTGAQRCLRAEYILGTLHP